MSIKDFKKMTLKSEKMYAKKIFELLRKEYPAVECKLEFKNPFQLLISTILSAQCTDERVNIVTKSLYKKYRKPEDFLNVPRRELEKDIYSTGFYRQKAKSIKGCCDVLVNEYKGNVPADFELLNKLPGVGRKTASVVAGNGFGIPAIAVDTHVKRLSNLLGFIKSNNPGKIEFKLKELLPEKDWINSSHYLATHGRNICIANRPKCVQCVLGNLCPSFNPVEK
ncbi:MAG TPA: endonuclease III [Ignavibacteriaceae bacterium]|nr:endonuclease III [Ignavibacteriaceae bacterium]